MDEYQDLVNQADELWDQSRFKEAHITYGRAMAHNRSKHPDRYCRWQRGLCSLLVAQERLQMSVDCTEQRQSFLAKTARWLAKAEANLHSAREEATSCERREILSHLAVTQEVAMRFLEESGGADPSRRRALAQRYRDESQSISHQILNPKT